MFKLPTRRVCSFIMALILTVGVITGAFAPKKAYAAYVQSLILCTVNTGTWEILAGAVTDTSSSGVLYEDAVEYRRLGGLLEDMYVAGIRDGYYPSVVTDYLGEQPHKTGGNAKKYLILTFPGDVSTAFRTSATDADVRRAQVIRNQLIFSLNDAFKWVMGDSTGQYVPAGTTDQDKFNQYMSDMQYFLNCINGTSQTIFHGGQTYTIYYSGSTKFNEGGWSSKYCPDAVTNESDFVYIYNATTKEGQYFLFRMPKGYMDVPGRDGIPETLGLPEVSADTPFVHWGHLAVEAFVNSRITDADLAVNEQNVYTSEVSSLTEHLTDFFITLANVIQNTLGLWDLDELIFNSGTRGSSVYAEGIFPSNWQPIVWAFFFISEIAAYIMIIYAILWNVGRRLASTVNPIMRASVMDQLKTLIICAILLGFLPVIYKILMNVSFHLTGAFAGMLGTETVAEKFGILSSTAGGLGSVLIAYLYLGILIYFNFLYLARGIILAFMMIIGPIAIASMAINVEKRQLVLQWAEEFFAQLFIQPIQALFLAFLLLLPVGAGRKIELLILVYSLIPLSKIAKKVIFPKAGDGLVAFAEKGQTASGRLASFGGGLALGAAGGIASTIGSMVGGGGGAGGNSGGGAGGGSGSSGSGGGSGGSGGSEGSGGSGGGGGSSGSSGGSGGSGNTEGNSGGGSGGGNNSGGSGNSGDSTSGGNANTNTGSNSDGGGNNSDPEVTQGTNTGSTNGSAEAGNALNPDMRNSIAGSHSISGGATDTSASANSGNNGTSDSADGGSNGTPASASGNGQTSSSPSGWSRFVKGFAAAAGVTAAIGLGALGGATDAFNRRVFGYSASPNGGMVTQFSRKLGSGSVALGASTLNRGGSAAAPASDSNDSGPGTIASNFEVGEAATPNFDTQNFNWEQHEERMQSDLTSAYTVPNSPVEQTDLGNGQYEYSVSRTPDSNPLPDIGITNIQRGSARDGTAGTSTVSYNPSNLSENDHANLSHLYHTYKNGTAEQKQQLQDMGIQNVTTTRKNDGQVSRVNVTYNNEAAQTNFGLNISSRGVSTVTDSATTPNFVPNIASRGIGAPGGSESQPAPEPAPAPQAAPAPQQAPEPAPQQAPVPVPNPSPTPAPQPTPAPAPDPASQPASAPASAPSASAQNQGAVPQFNSPRATFASSGVATDPVVNTSTPVANIPVPRDPAI